MKKLSRKAILGLLITLCLLILAGTGWWYFVWRAEALLGGSLLRPQHMQRLLDGKTEQPAQSCTLLWNGVPLPRGEDGIYCLPQPLEGDWSGVLSSPEGEICFAQADWAGQKAEAMAENRSLPVYVVGPEQYTRAEVVLSGVPVLYLQGELPAGPDELETAEMTLFWPDAETPDEQIAQGALSWHLRGNASLLADKHSYKLELTGDKQNLLGIRKDDDWLLVNLATDRTRTRDYTCTTLWNELAAASSWDASLEPMEYVELYVGEQYLGLYGFTAPVDQKTLKLNKSEGIIYKLRYPEAIAAEQFAMADELQLLQYDHESIQIEYPNEWRSDLWQPLNAYWEVYQRRGGSWQDAEAVSNLQNQVDVALFNQFICGVDDLTYNKIYALYSANTPMVRLPWDMNYSFGDCPQFLTGVNFTSIALPDIELDTLYSLDAARTQALVAERWQELRGSVFTTEHVMALLNTKHQQLAASGALARDEALWGATDGCTEKETTISLSPEETEAWLNARLPYLDEYLQSYTPPERLWQYRMEDFTPETADAD